MQKSSKSSKKRVLLLLILAAVLLAAVGLALYHTRSRALLDHTTDVLPEGSVWLRTGGSSVLSYREAGLASEVQLTPSEVEEFLHLVQEGWTGEMLPRSRHDGFDGFAPMSICFCEGEVTDPRAAGFIPPVSFLIYSNKVMDVLRPTLDAILPGGFETYPYTYGVYANWVPTTKEVFDFEDPDCTAFYPMTAEGWQALADWMDAKLAAAGTR